MKEKVVIFGGTSGIGLAAAVRLDAAGFEVHATGRNPDKVTRMEGEYPQIRFHVADSAREHSLSECMRKIGSLHHAVFSLGSSRGAGLLQDLKIQDVIDGFSEKTMGHLRSLKAALPHLSKEGSVTFVSGAAAQMSDPGTIGLAAINGAIEAMVRPLAMELAPLRVNAVCPGLVDTPWWDFLPEDQKGAVFSQYAEASLVGRVGQSDDLAGAIEFLVQNRFTTGTTLTCDGGLRLKGRG